MRDFLLERNLFTAAKPNLQRHHLNPPTAAHTKRTALDIFSIQISLIFWEALDRQVRKGRTASLHPPSFYGKYVTQGEVPEWGEERLNVELPGTA